jgi:hypothetical protein
MLTINKATYGGVDVTEKVKSFLKDGKLFVKAGNDVFGDLKPGVLKHLVITTNDETYSIQEGEYLKLPKTTINKLGIFYSNNNIDKVVTESLQNLKRFQDVADILTCVWRRIPNNPFYEVVAMTQSANHLNIIIQILQLLYAAKASGKYEYVSFLEHDVLYPDGYFDFPNFTEGVMTNMNYIGICKDGFQKTHSNHEPLHQMTMRFDHALSHFEQILKEAIAKGGVLVEPQKFTRLQWRCKNPAFHVNHGRNFTSHYSTYTSICSKTDAYWGDSKVWIERLF